MPNSMSAELDKLRSEVVEAQRQLAETILEALAPGDAELLRWYFTGGATASPERPKKRKAKKRASKKAKTARPRGGQAAQDFERWRARLMKPVLEHPRGSKDRTKAIHKLAEQVHTLPDGTERTYSEATFYHWAKQLEARQ
ncbi:MAG: hypothetical protein ACOC9W_05940 [Persicimonas sp.]